MRVTDEGLALIKEFEGFRAKAYRDAVGVWTIGYGHTSAAGEPVVKPGMVITKEEGTRILRRDVEMFAAGVRKAVKVRLNDNQFSALVSFAYNVGLGAFRTSSVLKAVNAKDFGRVPVRLNLWVKAGGKTLPGLVRRRAAEGALFASKPMPAPLDHDPQPEPPREAAGSVETEPPSKRSKGNGTAAGGAGAVIVGGGVVAVQQGWFPWLTWFHVVVVVLVVAIVLTVMFWPKQKPTIGGKP